MSFEGYILLGQWKASLPSLPTNLIGVLLISKLSINPIGRRNRSLGTATYGTVQMQIDQEAEDWIKRLRKDGIEELENGWIGIVIGQVGMALSLLDFYTLICLFYRFLYDMEGI
jgi:hypothetical protein